MGWYVPRCRIDCVARLPRSVRGVMIRDSFVPVCISESVSEGYHPCVRAACDAQDKAHALSSCLGPMVRLVPGLLE